MSEPIANKIFVPATHVDVGEKIFFAVEVGYKMLVPFALFPTTLLIQAVELLKDTLAVAG